MGHQLAYLPGLTMRRLGRFLPDEAVEFVARQAVYDYVDRIWEQAKARDLNPAIRPEWKAVAGLRTWPTR